MLLRKPMSNVNLFHGKDSQFRAEIIYFLATNGESSNWDISQYVSRKEISQEPHRKSMITKSHLGGVYRNITGRMLEEKYVEESGTRFSKGKKVQLYRLTFRGSLAVLALDLSEKDLKTIVEKNSVVNPFFRLILTLEKNGIKRELCDSIILEGMINTLRKNMINLSSDNESITGQSIIPALASHISSLQRNQLQIIEKKLEQLLQQKFPGKIMGTLSYYVYALISPLMWKSWSTTEQSQIITIHMLVDIRLHPKKYELNLRAA
ncbi:MAG: hypothetical protein ACT4N5_01435 [Nitrosopumilaceae archaeon]